jgi:hypothetical protein
MAEDVGGFGMAARRRLTFAIVAAVALMMLLPAASTNATTGRGCVDVSAQDGDSIQRAIDHHPRSTRFCLIGTFTLGQPLEPKDGQVFVGPAEITTNGSSDFAFDLKGSWATDVTVRHLDLWGFEISAINCWLGTAVFDSKIHDNGRNGLGCGLENRDSHVVIARNEVWGNGSEAELGSGSAGMKFARSGVPGHARTGVTVVDNFVHDNVGVGIWFDVESAGDVIKRNVITGNTRSGIMYEISHGPVSIRANDVSGNNTSLQDPSGGVVIYSSSHATVIGNAFGDNENWGVKVRDTSRGYALLQIRVHRNDMNGDAVGGCDLDGVSCDGNH